MTDYHLHISAGTGACKHIRFTLHKSSNDSFVGSMVFTRAELEAEIADYESARERVLAQIIGVILGNKDKTPAQLKTFLEAMVIRV